MSVDMTVPAIRFKGFGEEWEEKNVGQLGEIITGSTPSTQNLINYSNDGIPWVTPTDISKNVTFNTAKKLSQVGCKVARVVPKDTILVTCIASIGKNTILGTQGSFNQQINGVVPNEKESDPYFLFSASILWSEKLKRSAASGTMQIVNKTEFSELKTRVPKKEEQTTIGNYFQKLDSLINQHQQKHDKLSSIKKAMLEKMFPKQGETMPEIRFKGFSGEWAETVLSEIADKYDNLRVAVTAKDRIAGNTPYYGANGIQGYVEGYTHDGEHILLAEDGANDLKNYPIHYVNGKVWVNNHAHVLKAKKDGSNIFLKYALNNIDFEPFLVGGGRAKLNASIMMNLTLTTSTDIKEQIAIGQYFQKLDTLINQHQQQLTKLNNIKQACLSKMFV